MGNLARREEWSCAVERPFAAGNLYRANGVSFSHVVGVSQRHGMVATGHIFFDPMRGRLADFKSLEDIRRIGSGRFPATDRVEIFPGIYGDAGRESFYNQAT